MDIIPFITTLLDLVDNLSRVLSIHRQVTTNPWHPDIIAKNKIVHILPYHTVLVSRPSYLPLDILNTNLFPRLLVVIKPFPI